MERRMHHIHTQHSGGAPSYRLLPYRRCRVSRFGTRCIQRFIHGAVDERQFSDSVGFGNEGANVESIDAVKLTEKLETLETSHLLDINGDVTGF